MMKILMRSWILPLLLCVVCRFTFRATGPHHQWSQEKPDIQLRQRAWVDNETHRLEHWRRDCLQHTDMLFPCCIYSLSSLYQMIAYVGAWKVKSCYPLTRTGRSPFSIIIFTAILSPPSVAPRQWSNSRHCHPPDLSRSSRDVDSRDNLRETGRQCETVSGRSVGRRQTYTGSVFENVLAEVVNFARKGVTVWNRGKRRGNGVGQQEAIWQYRATVHVCGNLFTPDLGLNTPAQTVEHLRRQAPTKVWCADFIPLHWGEYLQ